ncbi:MAG TPA: peptidylprolyl isomerase [Chitinophagales bacterium]|nr:peptidylprolyl isomerase [Chitinophagales bacterium]
MLVRHILPAALLLLCTQLHAQPKLADKIIGIVDDRMILLSEIEAQYLQNTYQVTTPIPPDYKCELFNAALTEKLMVAQAIIDSVEVTDEQVESELDRRVRAFSNVAGSVEKLEEYYGKSILEMKDEFRPQVKENLLADGEKAKIAGDLKVTPSEVMTYFNKIPKDSLPYYNAATELGELVIYPKVSDAVRAYSKEKMMELLNRVKNGEDFATLASTYSEDPGSADRGGELGFVNRGELDPAFEAAAFSLKKPNEISDIVESAFGFHIIQLIERRGDRINVRHILIKPKTTSYDLTSAGKLMDSIYYLIQSGKYSFSEAVNKFSEDEYSKGNGGMLVNPSNGTNLFDISELGNYDQSLVPATDTLQVGAISKPMIFRNDRGETGFRMLYMKSKIKPHQANLKDDYNRIQDMALGQKQVDTINKWLQDRISKSYVFVAPEFHDCKVIKKWINNNQQ